MASFLGGCGPGWYMEGTAELMATHRLRRENRQTHARHHAAKAATKCRCSAASSSFAMPSRPAAPLTLPAVMQIDNRQQLEQRILCLVLGRLPSFSTPIHATAIASASFASMFSMPDFNSIVRREYDADWAELLAEWQAFVATLDHGYDFERMAIDFEPRQTARPEPHSMCNDRGRSRLAIFRCAARSGQIVPQ